MSSVLYAPLPLSAMALSYESPTVPGEAAIWNRCQTLWYTLLMYWTPWSLWWPSRLVSLWETAQYILCSNAFNGNCVVFIVDDSPSHDATREHVCNKHVYTRKPQMWVWHTWISVTCSRLGAYAVKSRFTRSSLPPVPFTLLVVIGCLPPRTPWIPRFKSLPRYLISVNTSICIDGFFHIVLPVKAIKRD